jgi:hypothetical protein
MAILLVAAAVAGFTEDLASVAIVTSLVTLGLALAIALTPLGNAVGFVALPASVLLAIAIIACLYLGSAEAKVLARGLLHRG